MGRMRGILPVPLTARTALGGISVAAGVLQIARLGSAWLSIEMQSGASRIADDPLLYEEWSVLRRRDSVACGFSAAVNAGVENALDSLVIGAGAGEHQDVHARLASRSMRAAYAASA